MTQVERILHELDGSSRGLTAAELHDRLRIPRNSLGTLIWEMKRDRLITRVGGVRGSYRYGVTQKGRAHLENENTDPLARLSSLVRGGEVPVQGFDAMMKVIDSLDSYKLLRSFAGWLTVERRDLLNDTLPNVEERLIESALEYLGVDANTFKKQRESLEALLNLM